MTTIQPGTKLIAYTDDKIIGIIEFKLDLYVATEGGVWKMITDETGTQRFVKIDFVERRKI